MPDNNSQATAGEPVYSDTVVRWFALAPSWGGMINGIMTLSGGLAQTA